MGIGNQFDTLILLSGGLDSVVLLARLVEEREHRTLALHFQLATRSPELQTSRKIARQMNVPLRVIDVRSFMRACDARREQHHLVFGSVVLFTMALTFANEHGIPKVTAALNSGDAQNEVEHQPETFTWLTAGIERLGARTTLCLPFHDWTKALIVQEGVRLNAPLEQSWSCVTPVLGAHDGTCIACVERQNAFRVAGVPDPTEYASFKVPIAPSSSAVMNAAPSPCAEGFHADHQ